jgi:hypothetical protein
MKTLKNVLVLTHRVAIAAALYLARRVKFRRLPPARKICGTSPSCRLCPLAGRLASGRCPRRPGEAANRGQAGA